MPGRHSPGQPPEQQAPQADPAGLREPPRGAGAGQRRGGERDGQGAGCALAQASEGRKAGHQGPAHLHTRTPLQVTL